MSGILRVIRLSRQRPREYVAKAFQERRFWLIGLARASRVRDLTYLVFLISLRELSHPMSERSRPRSGWVRLAAMGMELTAAVVGLAALGYALDRSFGWKPWGLLTCALIGLVGGMYNLIRDALRVSREMEAGTEDLENDRNT